MYDQLDAEAATQCYPSPHNQSKEIVEIPPAHQRIVAAGSCFRKVGGGLGLWQLSAAPALPPFLFLLASPLSDLLWLGNHNRLGTLSFLNQQIVKKSISVFTK
jgi:hypothetical protein